ncbi:hypothetical protein OB236_35530 [Paenibacillus sp. WQ 127069]|uniref:Extracellular solute-binding protein n=1 Tax=Paenibacillus baimaensis TaxID=2982185 RepID=A0ABT2US03_9BACL|nr:hypothetical protein [Paenibacillus sp. WQ 127069]MCU6797450.1 hypothetical protein [Paenibacillus sp. WQ 127069]
MRKAQVIGISLVLLVIIISVLVKTVWKPDQNMVTGNSPMSSTIVLKGLIGSEKEALFGDPDFQKLAKTKYGITLDTFKSGSLEMTDAQKLKDYDFVFPASQTVVEKLKSLTKINGTEEVFRTPLVYYSWERVVRPLEQLGIVQQQTDRSLTLDNKKLLQLVMDDKKWSDIGLTELYGPIVVDTSDPKKSNSGNSYAAIAADALSDGHVITQASIPVMRNAIQNIFAKSGFKKSSTTELFEEYLKTGAGSHKIIVGYESDVLYFAKQNPEVWKQLQQSAMPRMLYPAPTLWSVHTIVPLNEKARVLISFLKDTEVQKLAWERYGFRTGVVGNSTDISVFAVEGLSASIDRVMQLPDYETMEKLLEAFNY